MTAEGLPGLPGLPGGETQMQVIVSTERRFHNFAIESVKSLPDGGMQVSFIVPQTGELYVFPLNQHAAEKLGKQLVAPRVALPGNGLHSV